MTQLYANNARSALATTVAGSATTLVLSPGTGGRFPAISGSDFFLLTLVARIGTLETGWEIVRVTARSGDVLTVQRAQEGTVAATWLSGTPCELRLTAATAEGFNALVAATAAQIPTYSDTAPLNPLPGKWWFNTVNGRSYQYVVDGDGAQWVEAASVTYIDDPVSVAAAVAAADQAVAARDAAAASSAQAQSSAALAPVASTSAPVNPAVGKWWFNPANGKTYQFINDGTSSQWVEAASLIHFDGTLADDLAAADGSSLVGFKQAGSGAVVRSALSKMRERVSVMDFGAKGDGVTDDLAAFNAALAYFAAYDSSWYGNAGTILVPPGNYRLSGTLWIDRTAQLVGESSPYPYQDGVCRLTFTSPGDAVVFGWKSGVYATPSGKMGAGALLKNMLLVTTATTGAGHGIVVNTKASIEGVYVSGFRGHGIYVYAEASAGNGNANNFQISNVKSYGNLGCGLHTLGGDVNAGLIAGLDCSNNGEWGIYDGSFLGNTYVGCHTSGNVSGPYKSDNPNARNVFLGCYAEGGQPPSQIDRPAIVIGGMHSETGITGTGVRLIDSTLSNADLAGGLIPGYGGSVFGWGQASDSNAFSFVQLAPDSYGYTFANSGETINHPFILSHQATLPQYASSGMKVATPLGLEMGYGADARFTACRSAAPTDGTWTRGDRVLNASPVAGGFEGWICVTSGTPGTWKTYGQISA